MKLFHRHIPLLALALGLPFLANAQTLPATITVNAAATLTTFAPASVFGNNTAYWVSQTNNYGATQLIQQSGDYFLRYPGGSSSDTYHWNSSGSFDTNNHWVPSGTTYTSGFDANMTYVGTTGSNGSAEFPYSHLTDGNTSTYWLSDADTNFPNHQWAYMDLTGSNSAVNVSGVSILWGTPYATTYYLEYWSGSNNSTPYQAANESSWVTFGGGAITGGTGGTTVVTFSSSQTTRFIRILMTSSSAGSAGAYSIAEVYAYNGASLIGTNQASTAQPKVVVSSTDPASSKRYQTTTPGSTDFASFMTMIQSISSSGVSAIPMITVNYGTGTPAEAASWVYYANVQMQYGIKYWQVGNEQDGIWECGGPTPAADYAFRFNEFAQAMTQVDPTVIVTGPVVGGPYNGSNSYDGMTFIQSFLYNLNAAGNASALGALDFHWYPYYQGSSSAVELGTPSQVYSFSVSLNSWLNQASMSTSLPVIMSEYNISAGTPVLMNQLPTGLWLVNWLGEFIHYFGPRAHSNLWDVMNGSSFATSIVGDQGFLEVGGAYPNQPRANYWGMQMMATDWAIGGDPNAHGLVSAASTAATLACYADNRPDGVLSLMVVNKDATNSYATTINVGPFIPNATAQTWTFNANNYVWETATTPYHATPDIGPTPGMMPGVSSSFPMTFSPYSINVIQFTNSGVPTSTATSTRTVTGTPSPTSTLTFTPSKTPTVTATASGTGTSTATPSATFTFTDTGTSTATLTPPPTDTPAPTGTLAPSGTPTLPPTVTPIPSDTPTSTWTGSPTDLPTSTGTPTATPTSTATLTDTVCTDSLGNTCTFTSTPSTTATSTDTATGTATWTATTTDTPSATSTASSTGTPTDTATPTNTAAVSPTWTSTATLSPTLSLTPTSTPAQFGFYPNPVVDNSPSHINYWVPLAISKVKMKIYTVSFRKIFEDDNLSAAFGGQSYTLDWSKVGNISNGLYYAVIEEYNGGYANRQVIKILVLR